MFDIVIRTLNALMMIALPLVLSVYLYRKLGAEWRLFGIGVVTFVAAQMLHIPFNAWVLNPVMKRISLDPDVTVDLVVISLLLGLSAGLFEELARYIVYHFRLKGQEDRTWGGALMFGAGHGGIEAILIGIVVFYGFIQLFALKNADLEAIIPVDQLEVTRGQVELYWSAPWYATILGAVERAATLCFHMSATVLVLQAFNRKNIVWLFVAIGWHTILDAMAVFASQTWNIYFTEALIVVAGIIALGIVFLLREKSSALDQEQPQQIKEKDIEIENQKPSIDHLEDSRYV